MRMLLLGTVVAVALLAVGGCTSAPTASDWSCCDRAKATDGWCEQCKQGFVKGQSTACKACYGAMKSGVAACAEHAEKTKK